MRITTANGDTWTIGRVGRTVLLEIDTIEDGEVVTTELILEANEALMLGQLAQIESKAARESQ